MRHTDRFLTPPVVGTVVRGEAHGPGYTTPWHGTYKGVFPSQWDGAPVHFFTGGAIGTTPQGCFAIPVVKFLCPGCDQQITVTDGKTECGGEGEGICCVVADDDDPCDWHPDGHDPDEVALARATHDAASEA